MSGKSTDTEGVIVEFTQVGGQVKVTAIDTKSGREVSMIGTLQTSQKELSRLAVRKLKYVMEKEAK